jgi:ERF superfamily
MGAALTYARRYALFTLVGIAGEDDLDAPDLAEGVKGDANEAVAAGKDGVAARLRPAAGAEERPPATLAPRRTEKIVRPPPTVLGPEPSAALREQLLARIGQLQSSDEAADWVHKNLAAKNTMLAADADAVEAGFRVRLATIEFASAAGEEDPQSATAGEPTSLVGKPFLAPTDDAAAAPIILSGAVGQRRSRVAAKTIRLRDKEHCKFVATQPCVVCGRMPTEAHHIRCAQPRALGRKVSDEYTVPVCRVHHRELHAYGDEASWWAAFNIDPLPIALELWRRSHLSGEWRGH